MYISLRESRANGFKKWSDSQQQKYRNQGGSNEDGAVVTPGRDLELLDDPLVGLVMQSDGVERQTVELPFARHRLSPDLEGRDLGPAANLASADPDGDELLP